LHPSLCLGMSERLLPAKRKHRQRHHQTDDEEGSQVLLHRGTEAKGDI
jgi:hypothetical protein